MSRPLLSIQGVGLVTSVGLSAAASCAAFRTKISNPTETRFIRSDGDWIMAHEVMLERPCRGLSKLAKMAAWAIQEALQALPEAQWQTLPVLLCVAEPERPGRTAGLEEQLLPMLQGELGVKFSAQASVIAQGRVSVAVALARARALMTSQNLPRVLIAATDSLLSWPTLKHYEHQGRLLTPTNSNGFMPGEGAGALLVGSPEGSAAGLVCTGMGFAMESATIDSGKPLRAEGLSQAIKCTLVDAGCQMRDMDYRITDLAGEHYYFKEAALALSRTLRERHREFDLWHPAECTGEAGALSGVAVIAAAKAAAEKAYAKGSRVLAHWSNDAGQRAALSFHYH